MENLNDTKEEEFEDDEEHEEEYKWCEYEGIEEDDDTFNW